MELLFSLLEHIDIMYIVICNAGTYLLLQLIRLTTKIKQTTLFKRIVSAVMAFALGLLMHFAWGHGVEPIFYGFFLQFISWDYFFKPIVKRIQKMISGEDKVGEEF